jgi:hypothetical protein
MGREGERGSAGWKVRNSWGISPEFSDENEEWEDILNNEDAFEEVAFLDEVEGVLFRDYEGQESNLSLLENDVVFGNDVDPEGVQYVEVEFTDAFFLSGKKAKGRKRQTKKTH